MTKPATSWPTELKLDKDKQVLTVSFDDGKHFALPAELLRVLSPSAEVQGHSPEQRVTVPGKKSVRIQKLEPVGTYAVRITFDDGHNTGLYVWDYLRELGENQEALFRAYLNELADKGLSR
ncbi:MAG: DUF971 domain-containing protein [Methyloceanibacter sp.]|uniref:DUF971 domain-containing protein n=1 Tax=Methyloceanibacter sp. TaxID=1965321 RepID=UPI001DA09E39|nr:DUF971 domain-containing protein [Methyloceanibacter sp.]MCB1442436.1 DUF971 domain-containing protein [Methyloceanibacter sp.]MCC0058993.1 DUF971 domain-containing protein [Hyphomicrobiaceae bacterium]